MDLLCGYPPSPHYRLDLKIQLGLVLRSVSFPEKNKTKTEAGHMGVGFKNPIELRLQNPTIPVFRVG